MVLPQDPSTDPTCALLGADVEQPLQVHVRQANRAQLPGIALRRDLGC